MVNAISSQRRHSFVVIVVKVQLALPHEAGGFKAEGFHQHQQLLHKKVGMVHCCRTAVCHVVPQETWPFVDKMLERLPVQLLLISVATQPLPLPLQATQCIIRIPASRVLGCVLYIAWLEGAGGVAELLH